MKLEVDITKNSEEYIKETFSSYEEIFESPKAIMNRCVIHIYPHEDTSSEDGVLNGYTDALNFKVHIYDTGNNTVYKTKFHDQIDSNLPCRTRIFKDLSTMIIYDKPVRFLMGKSILVDRVR
ncbi:hypothetical protein [Paenibacillus polymyxa]|uniref:hypothetical protein n=1 Tax=Paenibacillus polymyxa TaxID=1406 RepID=UPI0004951517|nr:hypothetical protein [Paenibacillus polymyxa]